MWWYIALLYFLNMLRKITLTTDKKTSFFFGQLKTNKKKLPFFLKHKLFFVFIDSSTMQKKILQFSALLRCKMLTTQSILIFFASFDKKASRSFLQKFFYFLANQLYVTQQSFLFKVFLRGIGFKFEAVGSFLKLFIGFSHAVYVIVHRNITVKFVDAQNLLIFGFNKQFLGQFAAALSFVKKPNLYKNKGFFFINLAKSKFTKSLLFKTNFQKKTK